MSEERYVIQYSLHKANDEGELLEQVDTWTSFYAISDEEMARNFIEKSKSTMEGEIGAAKNYRKEIVEREPRFRKGNKS